MLGTLNYAEYTEYALNYALNTLGSLNMTEYSWFCQVTALNKLLTNGLYCVLF